MHRGTIPDARGDVRPRDEAEPEAHRHSAQRGARGRHAMKPTLSLRLCAAAFRSKFEFVIDVDSLTQSTA